MMFFTELMSFGQRAAYAWELFLIGMGTVFAVLALLWGEVALFRRLAEKANKQEKVEDADAYIPPTPRTFGANVPQQAANDDALIAVITAAVAAAMAEEQGTAVSGFRVVSYRRVGK